MDTFELFSSVLHQRLSLKRRSVDYKLSSLTHGIVYCIAHTRTFKFILDDVVGDIIKDCEIYYDMERNKARDSLQELSDLASVYANEDREVYLSILKSIERIRASYPAN